MKQGEHFIPVRQPVNIPESDKAALEKLAEEPYLRTRYEELRQQGSSIEDAWKTIWNRIELTPDDINDILMAFIGVHESSSGPISWYMAMTYEKIRSFHYSASPEAKTYILTKIEKKPEDQP